MRNKRLTIASAALGTLLLATGCSAGGDDTADDNKQTTQAEQTSAADQPLELPDKHLQKNDEGKSVKALQEKLQRIGYDIALSGTYDALTIWAVTDYQMQQDNLDVTGVYNDRTQEAMQAYKDNVKAIKPGRKLDKPSDEDTAISNPHEILALVNKDHVLPDGFKPLNLVEPDVQFPFDESLPKKQMRQAAATALEDMFQAANEEDLELFAQSGYRSFDRQDAIFASNVRESGEEAANQFSAKPGESEHQTGLTMDVTSSEVNFKLVEDFGDTAEGKWLKKNAADYGFIIRYPKGKQAITGYQYEPWHLRYVGEEAATAIMEQELTLEEYLGKAD
ncbi:hypothetical protein GCM10028778_26050 [Barrientosiimonas marina]|uniref:D-alanyl-D-alanine carboxypeptidase family protein n=1 Tax=Lentibacillus kimchii TaxID=1542911 RepID=A0ABW2UU84_9BACI